jgi:hypothetical protein
MSSIFEGDVGKKPIRRGNFQDSREIPNVAIFLKRITIEFLQVIFSTRAPGSYHYDADDNLTEVQISDQHAVDLAATHVRPAIIAVRGPLSWQGMGLGASSFESQDRLTGKQIMSDMLTGSVAFSCMSREGTEAENLAHIVFNSFKFFRPVLQRNGFFTIKSMNIGGESLVYQEGDNDDLYLVPVYVAASIQDRWSLSDEAARKLEKIVVESLTY